VASVLTSELGIRFTFDRQGRPVTPGVARLRRSTRAQFGLRNVTLTAGPGEGVALIGPNGAGKTTLLRALAGVYEPDVGLVAVRGRIGPLLSVTAGLIPLLTGREAAMHLAVIAGMDPVGARAGLEEIRRVSELGDAFDNVVSSYSQGMQARLGFATIAHLRPEVLLLDEVHQAFDHDFRATIHEMARRLLDGGGCVIAAGHDHAALRSFCNRAVLLRDGRVVADGPFDEVVDEYAFAAEAQAGLPA
jgi:ABC-type polysaccharide/polyol phosphate transport system ATPase subunit